MPAFFAAPRTPRYPSPADKATGNTGAFVKRAGVLSKYDVLSAGHMVRSGVASVASLLLHYPLVDVCRTVGPHILLTSALPLPPQVPLDAPEQALCMVRELTSLDSYAELCA